MLLAFHLVPVFYSFGLSVHSGPVQDFFARSVGFANYRALWDDSRFWKALGNTVWFVLGTVPTTLLLSLGLAILLNRKMRGLSFYRTAYFIPVITSVAAVSLVWKWVYHPHRGILNAILAAFDVPGLGWLSEGRSVMAVLADLCGRPGLVESWPAWAQGPSLAMASIIVMSIWKGLGYNIVIFLAGLQNIPQELYEAARIDGASPRRLFRHITWPLLSPTTYFVLILTTISSFQVFAQIFMLYAGNVPDSATVIVYYLYEKGFQTFDMGYASALAYVLFLIIFLLTAVQRRVVGSKVHYQ